MAASFRQSARTAAAAALAGIANARIVASAFILSSLLASMTGVLLGAYTGGAFLELGQPYLLQSVAAVVLGGTLIFGGAATAVGTFLASILLIPHRHHDADPWPAAGRAGHGPGGGRDPRAGARRPRARNPPQTSRGRPRRHRHAGRLMQPRCAVGRVAPARCDINGIGFGSCPGDKQTHRTTGQKNGREAAWSRSTAQHHPQTHRSPAV